MRFGVFSDLHAHAYDAHASTLAGGMNSRLQDCCDALEKIIDHCQEEAIKHVLFLGDLFHIMGEIKVQAFNRIFGLIALAESIHFLMIPGNHDFASENGSEHALEPFKALKNVTVFDRPKVVTLTEHAADPKVQVGFVPFIRDRATLVKEIRILEYEDSKVPKVLACHAYTHELMRKYTGREGDISAEELAEKADLVLLGHHHVHEIITLATDHSKNKQVVSVGTPLQHTFGERGFATGFIVVDTDTLKVEHIPIKTPEFKAFTGVKEIKADEVEGNFVRIKVAGKEEAKKAKDALEAAGAASIAIEIIPEAKESRIDLEPGLDDLEVIRRYTESEWGKHEFGSDRLIAVGQEYLKRGSAALGG